MDYLEHAVRALTLCVDDETLPIKVNVRSPHPASNAEVSAAIANTLGRPNLFTVPRFGLKALFEAALERRFTFQPVRPLVRARTQVALRHRLPAPAPSI